MCVNLTAVKFYIVRILNWCAVILVYKGMLGIAAHEFNLTFDMTRGYGLRRRAVHISIDPFAGLVRIMINVRTGIL